MDHEDKTTMPLWRYLRRLAVLALVVFAAHGVCRAQAQVGDPDSFNSNGAPDGFVHAIVTQSTGDIIIAGEFTTIGGTTRNRIARLKSDGTLDTAFATGAGANGAIRAISTASSGKIFIGGDFTTYDGVARNRIARLNTDGSLDTSFNPGTGADATIYALAADSVGGVFLGGDFTTVNGTTRNRIARLQNNGELDTFVTFGSGANGTVYTIAGISSSQPSPYAFIGGAFTSFNGLSRNHLVKVSQSSGSVDVSFNGSTAFGPDGPVYSISVPITSSVLYVGGAFNLVGGVSHPNLAVVSSVTGALVTDFTATANGTVRSMVAQASSLGLTTTTQLVIGGDFTTIDTSTRNHLARITGTTTSSSTTSWAQDTAYNPSGGSDTGITCLAIESDGKVVLGGQFNTLGGLARPYLARIYGDGGTNPPSTPATPVAGTGTDTKLLLVFSGVSYVTGYKIERSADGITGWSVISTVTSTAVFTDSGLTPGTPYFYRVRAYNTNGDGSPSGIASATTLATPWTLAGSVDSAFAANLGTGASSLIYAIALQPDGKILLGGSFSTIAGQSRHYIARINSDGSFDTSFDAGTGPNLTVSAITLQSDGKILVGGDFTTFGGTTHNRIVRLNSDGSLDSSFTPSSGANSTIKAMIVQPDGCIVICGIFTSFNGVSRSGIARINADGSLDTSFDPGAGLSFSNGYTLARQTDGKIIVGGFFQKVNGVTRGNIARLNSDGSLDNSFATGSGASGWIESLQLQPDGNIVIAGAFSTYNDVSRKGVARLLSDGSLDTSFTPGTAVENGWPYAVAAQPDGKIIIGGWFTLVQGKVRSRIARFNSDGSLDESFAPGIGASNDVKTLALQSDGKCIAGGFFSSMGESTAKYISRLLADNGSAAPATPSLLTTTVNSSTQFTLNWTDVPWESGYKIEQSSDGVNNWTLIATTGPDVASFSVTHLTPGTSYFFRVRANSTNGDSVSAASSTAITYTAYQQWKLDYNLAIDASDTADPDNDGLPTLLEYALGSSPTSESSVNQPVAVVNGANVELHYNKVRSDIIYSVESSTDLQTWTTTDVDQGGASPQVVASAPIGSTRKFLRLKVTLP